MIFFKRRHFRRTIIANAFPQECAADTRVIADIVKVAKELGDDSDSAFESVYTFDVDVDRETIHIPVRIYYDANVLDDLSSLTDRQIDLLFFLFTRHHNGYVRERALRRIVRSRSPWAPAYVVQLASEYVSEILDVVRENLPDLDRARYQSFLRDNPRYVRTVRSRIVSYWNEYYRGSYPDREGYVGFDILKYLDGLCADEEGESVEG